MRPLQVLLMAAIVATMMYLPLGGLLAVLAYAVLALPLQGFLSFGGALAIPVGLLAWWALMFVASLVYAAFAMPFAEEG